MNEWHLAWVKACSVIIQECVEPAQRAKALSMLDLAYVKAQGAYVESTHQYTGYTETGSGIR